jgi:hypothetical protein
MARDALDIVVDDPDGSTVLLLRFLLRFLVREKRRARAKSLAAGSAIRRRCRLSEIVYSDLERSIQLAREQFLRHGPSVRNG